MASPQRPQSGPTIIPSTFIPPNATSAVDPTLPTKIVITLSSGTGLLTPESVRNAFSSSVGLKREIGGEARNGCDAFVRITLDRTHMENAKTFTTRLVKFKSNVVDDNPNPVWDQQFPFEIPGGNPTSLRFIFSNR